jgi:hypothetical protein
VTMMLAPDLLDRRALALISLIDAYGRPVEGPVRIVGDGVRTVAKGGGRFAVLEAAGLEAHTAAFALPPATPALRSQQILIDLTPAVGDAAPRRFDLRLPRDPDPDQAEDEESLFKPAVIEMLPTARTRQTGSACLVRVTVVRDDDGRAVENALVRGRSDNGQFTARAMTDARGEACLVFPVLPLAFPGAGANVEPELAGRVIVTVDPAVARFHAAADVAVAAAAAAGRTAGHADPDALAGANAAAFAAGAAVRLAAGRQPSLTIEWQEP